MLTKAEELLGKLELIEESISECPTVGSNIEESDARELVIIEERKKYLEGVWDALKYTNRHEDLPGFLFNGNKSFQALGTVANWVLPVLETKTSSSSVGSQR